MFPLLLWLIPIVSVFAYLVNWPTTRPWRTRVAFDALVLVALVFICVTIRPGIPSDPRQAADVVQWRPYLSAIYVAALTILFLGAAGTVRYFVFRTPPNATPHI
jgi:hypothetical protein